LRALSALGSGDVTAVGRGLLSTGTAGSAVAWSVAGEFVVDWTW